MAKLTKTFSLTEPTRALLDLLARLEQRKQSAQMRYMIIRETKRVLNESDISEEVRSRLEDLLERAESEVYDPVDPPEEFLKDIEDLHGEVEEDVVRG